MSHDYDVIIVGGGLGGAALAKALSEKGIHVLVLERETVFRDRVRGELVQPWGVTEAHTLGFYTLLKQTCAYEGRYRDLQIAGMPPTSPRDLPETSPHKSGSLHFFHPEMQEVMLEAAGRAGAVVQRGVAVVEVTPGIAPGVRIQMDRGEGTYHARLVVGADGRTSACRKWAGFTVQRDSDRMMMAGVLFTGLSAPLNSHHIFVNPSRSEVTLQIPLGQDRFRCYYSFYQQDGRRRISGREAAAEFIEASIAVGAPREWFANAEVAGPLASFDCKNVWINHPYRTGVALVGDAAATSDPTYGCGLSLTLRDVRVLSSLLLSDSDWDAAGHTYAAEHDRYFDSLHRLTDWNTQLLYEPGPTAEARRLRAFERLAEDPRRAIDLAGLGPESPSDDAAYRNLFGEQESTLSVQRI